MQFYTTKPEISQTEIVLFGTRTMTSGPGIVMRSEGSEKEIKIQGLETPGSIELSITRILDLEGLIHKK